MSNLNPFITIKDRKAIFDVPLIYLSPRGAFNQEKAIEQVAYQHSTHKFTMKELIKDP